MDLQKQWRSNEKRLQRNFESIISRYSKDFRLVGDEVDLLSGEIIVNRGHIASLPTVQKNLLCTEGKDPGREQADKPRPHNVFEHSRNAASPLTNQSPSRNEMPQASFTHSPSGGDVDELIVDHYILEQKVGTIFRFFFSNSKYNGRSLNRNPPYTIVTMTGDGACPRRDYAFQNI